MIIINRQAMITLKKQLLIGPSFKNVKYQVDQESSKVHLVQEPCGPAVQTDGSVES